MKTAFTNLAGVLVSSAALAADPSPGSDSEAAPRYKLEPEQELVYESSYEFKHESGTHQSTAVTTYWVAGVNPKGGWHLIAQHQSVFTQTFGNSGVKNTEPQKEDRIGTFDLLPNGRIENLSDDYHSDSLRGPLIDLPEDLANARKGWESGREPEAKQVYRLLPESEPHAGKWTFSETQEGLFNTIYLSTSDAVIHFDSGRGLVTGSEGTSSQGYGFHGKGTTKVVLKSVSTKPKEWIDQLAEEASVLGRVRKAVDDLAKGNGYKIAAILDPAKNLLQEGRAQVKLPMIQAQFDTDLQGMTDEAKYDAANQEKVDAVMDKPAADWETTDLGGKKQRLADYRGKVVLLDFWYRGCGWCVRAMPQIKEVAEHYRDQPVAVLGMNTDREEKDAQFVADKLQLNYPTLKAAGLPEKYAVMGFPTLIIIDPDGVVRARHVGYSPTLRDDLIKTVDGLMTRGK